jgi:hypothetical protein
MKSLAILLAGLAFITVQATEEKVRFAAVGDYGYMRHLKHAQ